MSESNAKRNLIRNCTERGKKIMIDLVLALKSTFANMKVKRLMWFGTKKKSEAWSDITSLYNVKHKSGVKIIVQLKNIFNGFKLDAPKKRIHEK
ncbi:atypical protein kinase C-like, partial [Aphis craccivora]